MRTRNKYKNDKQNSDIALEELRKRYSKMCNNSDCVSYLFDELSLKDVKVRAKYINQLGKFIVEYYNFFNKFNNEQKLLIYNKVLTEYKNINILIGDASVKDISPLGENLLLNTLKTNVYNTFLRCERKRLSNPQKLNIQ